LEEILKYEKGLLELMENNHKDILDSIAKTKTIEDAIAEKLSKVIKDYTEKYISSLTKN
jgi:F0F1-type ATP synthase alpha subunit